MLELKNLTFEVPLADGSKETKRIIDDLSLTIPDGRFTVITGPNGGGKSTLAKLIMGVERATSGQILLDGEYQMLLGTQPISRPLLPTV